MQIFLMRHGQDLNPHPGKLTDIDLPLSELGKEQAARCATKIRDVLSSNTSPVIIASPRLRTIQAATIVSALLGLDSTKVVEDRRLIERNCAAYSGQLASEVFARLEDELVTGGMEPYTNLRDRLQAFYEELLAGIVAPTIIVTHSGNIEPFLKIANIDEALMLEADAFVRLS